MIAFASLLTARGVLWASVAGLLGFSSGGDDRPDGGVQPSAMDSIPSGVDLWTTPADGRTFSDFSQAPIPAGFFCPGSLPFSGKIIFEGNRIATVPEGAVGEADTIIHRLDNAVFDAQGLARTRVRFFALSLQSSQLLQTECGAFDVRLHLHGDQPVTEMRIQREHALGGRYSARLSVIAKLRFTPLGEADLGGERVLTQGVEFAPNRGSWARRQGGNPPKRSRTVMVDADGDGRAESQLPAFTNFAPGHALQGGQLMKARTSTPPSIAALTTGGITNDCHCDPNADFSGDPNNAFLEIPHCAHLHCPDGLFYNPATGSPVPRCGCQPPSISPAFTVTRSSCGQAHSDLFLELQFQILCFANQTTHFNTCDRQVIVTQPCTPSGPGMFTMSGVIRYRCNSCLR